MLVKPYRNMRFCWLASLWCIFARLGHALRNPSLFFWRKLKIIIFTISYLKKAFIICLASAILLSRNANYIINIIADSLGLYRKRSFSIKCSAVFSSKSHWTRVKLRMDMEYGRRCFIFRINASLTAQAYTSTAVLWYVLWLQSRKALLFRSTSSQMYNQPKERKL